MRMITLFLLSVVLLGMGGCSGSGDRSEDSSAQSAEPQSLLDQERQRADSPLQADRLRHDFGSVPIDGGNVETEFQVSNKGSSPVRVVGIYTSCACTTAMVEFEEGVRAGPFGMPGHDETQTAIDRVVGAGESLRVTVTFDPAFHGPEAVGKVMRVVTLHTEDGGGIGLEILADVVKA